MRGHRGGDGALLGVGSYPEVEGVGGVEDPHFGGVGSRASVSRLVEGKAVEDGSATPRGFVEVAINGDASGIEPKGSDAELAGAAVVRGGRSGRSELEC